MPSIQDPLIKAALGTPPYISMKTIPVTGILLDIYGLDELDPVTTTNISILWLHHPLKSNRSRMHDIAKRCVSAWNLRTHNHTHEGTEQSPASSERGLIAIAFDQRNHGSREVDPKRNDHWRGGNETHARDMFGVIQGTVADTRVLIDVIGAFLFATNEKWRKDLVIDQHLMLGVSLGAHSGWQLMFADPRVTAAVLVIGCPDYAGLMKDRARRSKLKTFDTSKQGATFLGSHHFDAEMIRLCDEHSAKSILFGTMNDIPKALLKEEEQRLRVILNERVRNKKFLLCNGAVDKLVPYACSERFIDWFRYATRTWYADGNVSFESITYEERGHEFSGEMITDAVKFICDAVADAGATSTGTSNAETTTTSKI